MVGDGILFDLIRKGLLNRGLPIEKLSENYKIANAKFPDECCSPFLIRFFENLKNSGHRRRQGGTQGTPSPPPKWEKLL